MTPISGLGSKGPEALGSCNDCGEPVVGSSLCDECWAKHQELPPNAIVPLPPKIEPVEEAVKKTLDAFAELISALVAVGRFHEVQRLITIGISLQRVKKQSAEDYLAREEQEGMFDGNGLIIPAAPMRGMNVIGAGAAAYNWGAGNDTQQLSRELILMLEKMNAAQREKGDAAAARDEAAELLSLQDVLKGLPPESPHRVSLGTRIDRLVTSIAERTTPHAP